MKVLTVTANAAIDVTLFTNQFRLHDFNRANGVTRLPGGKGNNVARILNDLGHEVIATGFVGGRNGEWIEGSLRDRGITADFVMVSGESRSCYAILEADTKAVTEIVEPGIDVNQESSEELLTVIEERAKDVDAVVISGSLPPGLPNNYYASIIRVARAAGARFIVLDASGEPLAEGIAGQPDMIKPNASEILSLLGTTNMKLVIQRTQEELLPLLAPGGIVVISTGKHGVIAVQRQINFFIAAPEVVTVNTVGCGDALVAGYIHGRLHDWSQEVRLDFATACGTAASLQATAGYIAGEEIEKLFLQVMLQKGGDQS